MGLPISASALLDGVRNRCPLRQTRRLGRARSDNRATMKLSVHVAIPAAIGFALAGTAMATDTCDELRAQIETKIRTAGVEQFALAVVDAAASAPGKVVGTCERGAKKIVYVRGQGDAILTECKDGSVSVGGRCGK
jgi:hypothetical protein